MRITLLVDNPKSWYLQYADCLLHKLQERGHTTKLVQVAEDIPIGDIALFLSCEKIISREIRDRNKYNLVVHSSRLPQGKGWSPLTHQIIAGNNIIWNTLFEAVDKVDAGVIYAQEPMEFKGTELLPELHAIQGAKIGQMILAFVDNPTEGKPQVGKDSFLPKRTPKHSELSMDKSLAEQFDLLRVVDNEQYPAWFKHRGRKYIIYITPDDDSVL